MTPQEPERMSFRDEDLKRLKDRLTMYFFPEDEMENIKALIARLEAAEDCIGFNSRHSEWESRYEAWRKACGK